MPTAEISEKFEYRIEGLLAAVSEAVAETSDELMEKFFEGEAFTQKELIDGIHNGMNRGMRHTCRMHFGIGALRALICFSRRKLNCSCPHRARSMLLEALRSGKGSYRNPLLAFRTACQHMFSRP